MKPIKGWEGKYFVTKTGLILRNGSKGLAQVPAFPNKYGYATASLYDRETGERGSVYVTSIVMAHYGKEQKDRKKWVVTHIDKNKMNNHIDNLKWIAKEDMYKDSPKGAIPVEIYNPVTGETLKYRTITEASKSLGTCSVHLRRVAKGVSKIKKYPNIQIKIKDKDGKTES